MKIFGLRIIEEKLYQEMEKAYFVRARVSECHRWFSGWKDLDIIWNYLLMPDRSVGYVRDEYATARGTTIYGEDALEQARKALEYYAKVYPEWNGDYYTQRAKDALKLVAAAQQVVATKERYDG